MASKIRIDTPTVLLKAGGKTRPWLHQMLREGKLPKPHRLGNAPQNLWFESEIDEALDAMTVKYEDFNNDHIRAIQKVSTEQRKAS